MGCALQARVAGFGQLGVQGFLGTARTFTESILLFTPVELADFTVFHTLLEHTACLEQGPCPSVL